MGRELGVVVLRNAGDKPGPGTLGRQLLALARQPR